MQQTCKEGVQGQAQLSGESDPLGIVQTSKIWSYWQMVLAQSRNCPRKCNA